jgi:hypothetical protein
LWTRLTRQTHLRKELFPDNPQLPVDAAAISFIGAAPSTTDGAAQYTALKGVRYTREDGLWTGLSAAKLKMFHRVGFDEAYEESSIPLTNFYTNRRRTTKSSTVRAKEKRYPNPTELGLNNCSSDIGLSNIVKVELPRQMFPKLTSLERN